ncbi:MAG: hypothetical protein AAF604_19060 [Acidobacteriota bacterium]
MKKQIVLPLLLAILVLAAIFLLAALTSPPADASSLAAALPVESSPSAASPGSLPGESEQEDCQEPDERSDDGARGTIRSRP